MQEYLFWGGPASKAVAQIVLRLQYSLLGTHRSPFPYENALVATFRPFSLVHANQYWKNRQNFKIHE